MITTRPRPTDTDGTEPTRTAPGGCCACCSQAFVSFVIGGPLARAVVRQTEWVCAGCAELIDEQAEAK